MSNKLCNKVGNTSPSYLTQRNGIYYFCYRIPTVISTSDKPKVIRRSLRTSSISEARERMTSLFSLVNQAKQVASKQQCDDMIETEVKRYGFEDVVVDKEQKIQEDIQRLNRQLGENLFSYVDSKIVAHIDGEEIFASQADADELDEQTILDVMDSIVKSTQQEILNEINQISDYISSILNVVNSDEQFDQIIEILTDTEKRHKRNNIRIFNSLTTGTEKTVSLMYGELSDTQKEQIRNCAEKIILNLSAPITAARAFAEGKFSEFRAVKEGLEIIVPQTVNSTVINSTVLNSTVVSSTVVNSTVVIPESVRPESVESASPLISEVIPEFLRWEDNDRVRTPDIVRTYTTELEILMAVIGDKTISSVTKQNINEVINVRRQMPKRYMKPYNQWSISETVGKIRDGFEPEDEDDLVAPKTVKESFKVYQSFFSAFICNFKELIKVSPTNGIKVPADTNPYGKYSDPQMDLIVEYWSSQPDSPTKMVILAAAYTGMRKSEIVNLTSDRVRYDDESKRHYIFIDSGKTKAARRIVPIPHKLINLGFINYICELKQKEKLYTKKSDLITEALKESRDILNIPHVDTMEHRLVFHSLRHSVISKARAKGVSDPILQRVVGHQTKKSITDIYTHFDVKDVLCVVDCLPW